MLERGIVRCNGNTTVASCAMDSARWLRWTAAMQLSYGLLRTTVYNCSLQSLDFTRLHAF